MAFWGALGVRKDAKKCEYWFELCRRKGSLLEDTIASGLTLKKVLLLFALSSQIVVHKVMKFLVKTALRARAFVNIYLVLRLRPLSALKYWQRRRFKVPLLYGLRKRFQRLQLCSMRKKTARRRWRVFCRKKKTVKWVKFCIKVLLAIFCENEFVVKIFCTRNEPSRVTWMMRESTTNGNYLKEIIKNSSGKSDCRAEKKEKGTWWWVESLSLELGTFKN